MSCKLTLIYVTHDQVEALTFAEEVVVMTRGRAVQVGSADALFERPQHTFVGHFIGSPGMNFLPATVVGGALRVADRPLALPPERAMPDGDLKLGVRPEYVVKPRPATRRALPCTVTLVQDIGTHLDADGQRIGEHTLKARLNPAAKAPRVGEEVWLQVLGPHTCLYRDDELVAHEHDDQTGESERPGCWCCRSSSAWPSPPSCRS
jgi:glycerol transport system ATP-binding protein